MKPRRCGEEEWKTKKGKKKKSGKTKKETGKKKEKGKRKKEKGKRKKEKGKSGDNNKRRMRDP